MHPVLFCYHQLWKAIDGIYPPICAGCQKIGYRLCDDCLQKIRVLEDPLCSVCGLPVNKAGVCQDCGKRNGSHFLLRSWGIYEGPLRNAIHQLKYNSDIGVAEVFSGFMSQYLERLNWDFDMIVPVPITEKRKRERGFNQSALLARLIAMQVGKPFSNKALKRIRHTESQTRLSAIERRKNVENAFEASRSMVKDKRIILVDDIATTCSTLKSCTSALKMAGASTVYSFTLARTLSEQENTHGNAS